jgi:hypothetical protein
VSEQATPVKILKELRRDFFLNPARLPFRPSGSGSLL